MKRKIVKNQIKCAHCGELVESTYRHDFHTHSCDAMKEKGDWIAADGGKDYLRRVGNHEDWIEASEYSDDAANDNGGGVRQEGPDSERWTQFLHQDPSATNENG